MSRGLQKGALGVIACLFALLWSCAVAQADTLDWNARPATNLRTGGTDAATSGTAPTQLTITTSGSVAGTYDGAGPNTLAIEPGSTSNGTTGYINSTMNAAVDNETSVQTTTINFSEQVYNASVVVGDIDGGPTFSLSGAAFNDIVEFRATDASGATILPTSGTPVNSSIVTWNAATGRALAEEMDRLVAADLPIREELWGVDEAIDHLTRVGWHEAAAMLRASREPAVAMVSCGQVYAPRMGPLVPRTGYLVRSSLEVEGDALVLRHGPDGPLEPAIGVGAHESTGAAPGARDAMAREHERWLASLGMDSVGAFNAACVSGRVDAILRVAEGFHEKRIGRLADEIAARLPDTRVVCVAGPSSSGKTTFLKRLSVQLQVMGIRPVGISLDDYYVDRERTPRDDKGEFDFETIDAIDVPLLGQHLAALTRGECVRTARYDFRDGRSLPDGGPEVRLGARDVLLLEGIHGLNPRLTAADGLERAAMKVFIMPMTSLPFDRLWRVNPSDVRLLRRIVRDRHGRNHDAAATILRWPSVRAGERKHIFPFFDRADFVFDSSLVYELSALKVYAERYLLEVPPTSPAYTTAFRLRQLIDRFVAIHAEHIPPTSILREFIGDSAFSY